MFCQTLKSAFIHKIFQHGCVLSAKPVFLEDFSVEGYGYHPGRDGFA